MAKEFAKAFYNSKAWQESRNGYIKSVFGLCEKCKQPGYIVHHKIKLATDNIDNPDVTLNWDNLQYLCLECHNKEHGEAEVIRHGLMFDAQGQLVARPPY